VAKCPSIVTIPPHACTSYLITLNNHKTKNQMRKIRIIEHISLDGVIEHGEDYEYGGWTVPYRSPAGLEAVIEAHGTGFDLLLGRRTYEILAGFWPKAGNHPMADSLNAATKYVATHRPDNLEWGPIGNLGADIIE